jgi:uncharacterized protein YfaS (alpha-2-macroglobulin family)
MMPMENWLIQSHFTSNEFGSYHGKFNIPENRLSGEFTISDEKNNAHIGFSVEEYKRPTFEVSFDTIKTSYQLGDTVKITWIGKCICRKPLE